MSIASIRKEYTMQSLSESDTDPHPLRQFDRWWDEALQSGIDEVNAMTLSTVSEQGKPSSRIVLLKGCDDRGFVFYTNYRSRKGLELETNPHASLLFFWKELERQIRIEGICSKVSPEESDAYYASRPEGSRIGAWASPQSQVIESRDTLKESFRHMEERLGGVVHRPDYWGGYRLNPNCMEFWQGRPNRLHDRIRYRLTEEGEWSRCRLAP
ncbi:MAG: pyridoxamine 5'-phosphate oxidase [Chitinophagia bacterium]|nr:pyridoxamine 5'-phosphate oxidase [Chitinophagia bacterium]